MKIMNAESWHTKENAIMENDLNTFGPTTLAVRCLRSAASAFLLTLMFFVGAAGQRAVIRSAAYRGSFATYFHMTIAVMTTTVKIDTALSFSRCDTSR